MVETIQVLAKTVHAIVAIEDAVRVEHGNDHEIEVFSQKNCLRMFADQELNESL